MPTIVSSEAQAAARGIYIIFRKAAASAKASGTGRAAMVAQLPWGPTNLETAYVSSATFRDTFAPFGFPRTSTGYLMATKFPWVDLQIVRIAPVGIASSALTLSDATNASCISFVGKYQGAQGNNIQFTLGSPTNGVVTSYKLTLSITDSTTGLNTTEIYDNVDATQHTSAAYLTSIFGASKLVAVPTGLKNTKPTNFVVVTATPSTTLTGAQTFPEATITVGATAGFTASGFILAGIQLVAYTTIGSGTTFTGGTGGTGTLAGGTPVLQATLSTSPQLMTGGSDGATAVLNDYTGTQGSNDKGLAVLESDNVVKFVFTDDPPSAIVGTLNAAMMAHEQFMNDGRFAVICGAPGETQATAITNIATLHDAHVVYHYGHAKVNDDVGTSRIIPFTGPWCSLVTLMTPHLSPAYKNTDFTKFMQPITGSDVGLVATQSKISLEQNGITAWEQNDDGTITPYTDLTTDVTGLKVFEVRMRDYIAFTIAARLVQFRNGPNDDIQQSDERSIVRDLLEELLQNRKKDHIFKACILNYGILSPELSNSAASLAAGDFTIGYQVQLIASQRRIFLSGEIGTGVTVTVS